MKNIPAYLAVGVLALFVCACLVGLGEQFAQDSMQEDCDKINATVIDGKAYQCWRADLEIEAAPAWDGVPRKEYR